MLIALIHSPLVGPFSWTRVADALTARGVPALVPELRDDAASGQPYWQQQAGSVAAALNAVPHDEPLVLVGHSGAGALLPAIRAALGGPGTGRPVAARVAGYVFVDAGLPLAGQSRLASFGAGQAEFRDYLAAGGRFPNWTIADLCAILPDAATAERLAADQRPRGLDFWEERLPAFAGWSDAPGAYLLFTDGYRPDAEQARALGWPVRELPAGHFHMLVAPQVVTDTLLDLIGNFKQGCRMKKGKS